jgi:hypothetical protein
VRARLRNPGEIIDLVRGLFGLRPDGRGSQQHAGKEVKLARAEVDRARNLLGEVNGRNTRREAAVYERGAGNCGGNHGAGADSAAAPAGGAKTVGALPGALGAMVFDILVAASENLTVFLVALITVFAALAGLMQLRWACAPTLAQGGAMFAVAAPMLPAPDVSPAAMATGVKTVCVGFMVATGIQPPGHGFPLGKPLRLRAWEAVRRLGAVILVNLVTNPSLNYLLYLNAYFGAIRHCFLLIVLLEAAVILVEWALLVFALRGNKLSLFVLSFIMNVCSYLTGVL